MTPEQEDALAEVDATARRYERTRDAHAAARTAAHAAALRALRAGIPPSAVERRSPFTGSYVRHLARDAGIPADTRYQRPPR